MILPEEIMRKIYTRIVCAMTGDNPKYTKERIKYERYPIHDKVVDSKDEFDVLRGNIIHDTAHYMFGVSNPHFQGLIRGTDIETPTDDKLFRSIYSALTDINHEHKTKELFPHLKPILDKRISLYLEKQPELYKTENLAGQVFLRLNTDAVDSSKLEYPEKFSDNLKRTIDLAVEHCKNKGVKTCAMTTLHGMVQEVYHMLGGAITKEVKDKRQVSAELMNELKKAMKSGDCAKAEAIKQNLIELSKGSKAGSASADFTQPFQFIKINKTSDLAKGDVQSGQQGSLAQLKQMKKFKEGDRPGGGPPREIRANPQFPVKEVKIKDYLKYERKPTDFTLAIKQGRKINHALRKGIFLRKTFEKKHRSGLIDMEEVMIQGMKYGRIVNQNVFHRKGKIVQSGEVAVSVLVDFSGSMTASEDGKQKIEYAKEAAYALYEGFKGIDGIVFEIYGFSSVVEGDKPIEIPIKTYRGKIDKDFAKVHPYHGNLDGENILMAVRRIKRIDAQKRVIIVISDGMPAYSFGQRATRAAVELARRNSIKVLGIGIPGCSEDTEKIYEPYYVDATKKIKELDKILIKTMLTAINGRKTLQVRRSIW
jgi:hypothetical protein